MLSFYLFWFLKPILFISLKFTKPRKLFDNPKYCYGSRAISWVTKLLSSIYGCEPLLHYKPHHTKMVLRSPFSRPFHAKKSRQEVSSYLGSRFLPRILIQDKTFDVLQICIFRQLNYRFLCRFLNFFFMINSFLIIFDWISYELLS